MASSSASQLASYENLVWAWLKLLKHYRYSEVWYDELELSKFELNLDSELSSLASDFQSGRYATRPVRPIPYPKRNSKGQMEARQFFWVNIRDQLAWLAYLNLVGADIDSQMPAWSYGNRLFRSLIVDQPTADDIPRFTSGPYRNTKAMIYRPFKQSWPLYRRHVLLALKKLTRLSLKLSWDEREERLLDAERALQPTERLVYLRDDFWEHRSNKVYWCSFDIEKFYPSVSLERTRQVLLKRSDTVQSLGRGLLESLTRFEIDLTGWTRSGLESLGLSQDKTATAIPTGLICAGFLANAAMLPVDDWAATQVKERQIAHFRYVDDHIVVAPNFDRLSEWFSDYQRRIQSDLQCKINEDKTEPEKFRLFLKKRDSRKRKIAAMRDTSVDPAFPSPLMTKTLEKVSHLAHTNFDLLDREEQQRILNDLEHLLLAQLPEEELPEKTRVTFAATLLSRFAAQAEHKNSDLLDAVLEHNAAERESSALEKHLRSLRRSSKSFKELRTLLPSQQLRGRALESRIASLRKAAESRRARANRATTAVLLKALELHPEKLRMWERVVEFCRRTGGSATTVNDSLRSVRHDHPLAYSYISARILQLLARQIAVCVNEYFNADLSLDRRVYAASFLSSIPLALRRLYIDRRYQYVDQAHKLSKLALSFANFIVRAKPRGLDLPSAPGIRLRAALVQRERFRFDNLDPAEIWWIARNFSVWSDPGIKFAAQQVGLKSLAPGVSHSWKIWRYLDLDIPDRAFRFAAASDLVPGVEGWVAEILHSKPSSSCRRLTRLKGAVGRVAKALTTRSRRRWLLPDWIKWTASSGRDPFDPRLSEWTALEISVQIAQVVREYAPEARKEVVSSVFNYFVPQVWTDNPTVTVTWEEWKQKMADAKVVGRQRLVIRDARVMPSAADFPDLNIELGSVRGLAILLLGLLRRDFRLPNHLLPIGYHGLLSKAAIAHIQSKPCSSRTMAILESCLMDRTVETLWMKERAKPNQRLEEDIATDVPLIQSVEELIEELRNAQQILAKYQLTVSAHQPRQLIPVYLEQYTKETWRAGGDVQEEQEDAIE